MKKAIALCASMAVCLSMFGVAPQMSPMHVDNCQHLLREANIKTASMAQNKRTIKAIANQSVQGVTTPLQSTLPSAPKKVHASRAGLAEGVSLHESFEGWDGELTISAPGVQKVFAVSEHSGIEGVVGDAEAKTPVVSYSITGQVVDLDQVKSGVYVVKYSDSTATKVCVR